MKPTESALRAIKDRIAAALGELEETASDARRKHHRRRLENAAAELHRCADELQNILMRIPLR